MGEGKRWWGAVLPIHVALGCDGGAPRVEAPTVIVEAGAHPAPDSAVPPPSPSAPQVQRLEPGVGCVHPQPVQRCEGGYCEVPPGCFIMGAPRGEPGAGRLSNVQVQVTLTHGFSIGQTELTRAAWLEAGWGKPKRNIQISSADCLEPSCPVNNVSFFDAVRYANWLSERDGLPACYELSGCSGEVGLDLACTGVQLTSESAYACAGYRLPTEAEWEYATRAGSISAFHGGEAVSTILGECVAEPALDDIGWYCRNSADQPHLVAQKLPNAWGLQDVHGNLGEWVNDLFDGLGYGPGPLPDPHGTLTPGRDLLPNPSEIELRIYRGGGFAIPGDSCTAADRGGGGRSFMSSSSVGFRLVKTVGMGK